MREAQGPVPQKDIIRSVPDAVPPAPTLSGQGRRIHELLVPSASDVPERKAIPAPPLTPSSPSVNNPFTSSDTDMLRRKPVLAASEPRREVTESVGDTPREATEREALPPTSLIDRALARRGLSPDVKEELAANIAWPDAILVPGESRFKTGDVKRFIDEIVPERDIPVKNVPVASGVNEEPFGPEMEEGAQNRTANALALVHEIAAGTDLTKTTGDPEFDNALRDGSVRSIGSVGAMENGMVRGDILDNGEVALDETERTFDPNDTHFDVACAIVSFPGHQTVTKISPSSEAVQFDPRDAQASADSGFAITAGKFTAQRLAAEGITNVDHQNWHKEVIAQEIAEADRLQAVGLPIGALHTREHFDGFDRHDQLAGVFVDALLALARQNDSGVTDKPKAAETPGTLEITGTTHLQVDQNFFAQPPFDDIISQASQTFRVDQDHLRHALRRLIEYHRVEGQTKMAELLKSRRLSHLESFFHDPDYRGRPPSERLKNAMTEMLGKLQEFPDVDIYIATYLQTRSLYRPDGTYFPQPGLKRPEASLPPTFMSWWEERRTRHMRMGRGYMMVAVAEALPQDLQGQTITEAVPQGSRPITKVWRLRKASETARE